VNELSPTQWAKAGKRLGNIKRKSVIYQKGKIKTKNLAFARKMLVLLGESKRTKAENSSLQSE